MKFGETNILYQALAYLFIIAVSAALTICFFGSDETSALEIEFDDSNINFLVQVRDNREEIRNDLKAFQALLAMKDVEAVIEFKRAIESKWNTNADVRLLIVSEICKSLNSGQFNNPKHTLYARRCAKEILRNVDEMAVDTELDMVKILQEIEEYRLGVVGREQWTKDRAERIGHLRHVFERIDRGFDPDFDFRDKKNIPLTVVCVPAPKYRCGTRPEDVTEPEIRAKYITAIEENRRNVRKFNTQIQIHRLIKQLPAFVDQFIIGMYSLAPADFTELESAMDSISMDHSRKETIRRSVKENLEIR